MYRAIGVADDARGGGAKEEILDAGMVRAEHDAIGTVRIRVFGDRVASRLAVENQFLL